ncbi:hypothetical protein PIB30_086353 [Stylosanthes scabra]|uniref:Zinc knuckle CX2CX4HX4C domain-containing protein n=1 Tax=Stylosanthes scabra TaxID=79078 RepID=A0ABU6RT12_9FABA|nr:hypothetical protein [Stylosanthes scabra]
MVKSNEKSEERQKQQWLATATAIATPVVTGAAMEDDGQRTTAMARSTTVLVDDGGRASRNRVRGKEFWIVNLKIEIDGSKKVKDNLKLAGSDKIQKEVGLRYEHLEIVCTYCAHIDHEARHCQLFLQHSSDKQIQPDAIGEWVKTNQIGRRIERKAETNLDSGKFPNVSF